MRTATFVDVRLRLSSPSLANQRTGAVATIGVLARASGWGCCCTRASLKAPPVLLDDTVRESSPRVRLAIVPG